MVWTGRELRTAHDSQWKCTGSTALKSSFIYDASIIAECMIGWSLHQTAVFSRAYNQSHSLASSEIPLDSTCLRFSCTRFSFGNSVARAASVHLHILGFCTIAGLVHWPFTTLSHDGTGPARWAGLGNPSGVMMPLTAVTQCELRNDAASCVDEDKSRMAFGHGWLPENTAPYWDPYSITAWGLVTELCSQ